MSAFFLFVFAARAASSMVWKYPTVGTMLLTGATPASGRLTKDVRGALNQKCVWHRLTKVLGSIENVSDVLNTHNREGGILERGRETRDGHNESDWGPTMPTVLYPMVSLLDSAHLNR